MPVGLDEKVVAEHVDRAVRGDADALQRLFVHYHAILQRKVNAKIGTPAGRRIDADDVLQQAYVSAFKSVGGCSFDGPGGFYKWLEAHPLD